MIKLEPIKSEKIWGYELWIASTHPNGCQKEFLEAVGGDYPLLVKIIQANDTLSIQVHPDDEQAVKLEGEGNRGKTECWYVLDAEPDAKIVYGIKSGYTDEVLAKAIEDNTLEQYLEYVKLQKGDFVFIPAGTVHAIGGGLRLLEVQQSCDLTYRLYDWGRGREVHIQKGLAVIKREGMIPVAPFPGNFDCEYFNLKTIESDKELVVENKAIDSGSKNPCDWQLIYIISAENAFISSDPSVEKTGVASEEIYAVAPGEKITLTGKVQIMQIKAK